MPKVLTQAVTLVRMDKKAPTRLQFAENLNYLIQVTDIEINELHRRSGLSISAIRKIRLGNNTSLDSFDAIARAFGLPLWLMINRNLPALFKSDNREWLERVMDMAGEISPEGRSVIEKAIRAAESIRDANEAALKLGGAAQ